MTMELSAFLKSSRASRPCPLDPNCLYSEGHTCPCTPVEIGQYVARKREDSWRQAYRNRLQAILDVTYAKWLDDLVTRGTSPLLLVGWVSKGASTWHRDRYCNRNKAMGTLAPVLYLEISRLAHSTSTHPCAGCGQLTAEEKAAVPRDWQRLKEARRNQTEGLCWLADYADCGADAVPGTTVCAKHQGAVTEACRVGRHEECDKIWRVHTRKDGSTYITHCPCSRCDHPAYKKP